MSSKLNQNTLDLQSILELVNNLPEAGEGSGGSGGGLPSGVSALATGTYTSTSDATSVNIEHGLGVAPNFCAWCVEDDLSADAVGSLNVFGAVIGKKHKINASTTHNTGFFYRGYNASGTMGGAQSGGSYTAYLTDTQCRLCGNSTYKFLTGWTYRWVTGVLDGIE